MKAWLAYLLPAGIAAGLALLGWMSCPSIKLDVGVPTDARHIHGFYAPEWDGSATFRWSLAQASLTLPRVPEPAIATLAMAAHPGGTTATVTIDTTARYTFTVAPMARRTYTFLLPPRADESGLATLQLSSTVATLGTSPRSIGLMVDSVALESVAGVDLPPALPLVLLPLLGVTICWLIRLAGVPARYAVPIAGIIAAAIAIAWSRQRLWVAPALLPTARAMAALGGAFWLFSRLADYAQARYTPARAAQPRPTAPNRAARRPGRRRIAETAIGMLGVALALAVRYPLRNFASYDFTSFTNSWYTYLKEQGFGAIQLDFSNYTPLYLYMLYIVSVVFPHTPNIVAVKIPSVVFDVACAYCVYTLVELKYPNRLLPTLAFLCALFSPTMILNSALWGQSDSIYATLIVAGIAFLATSRETPAFLAFGLAFAFKFQSIFMFPLLAALAVKRVVAWKSFRWIPFVYGVTLLPALVVGRPLGDLLTVYLAQADTYQELTLNAPNLYAWFPDAPYTLLYPLGLVLTAAVTVLYIAWVYRSTAVIALTTLVELALVSVLLVPSTLPKMHERYFFLADILGIVFGFYVPKYAFLSAIIIAVSLLAYLPFLFDVTIVPIALLAVLQLAVISVLIRHTASTLFPQQQRRGGAEG